MQMKREDGAALSHRVPLEIKTGKMYRKQGSLEHRALRSHPVSCSFSPIRNVLLFNISALSSHTLCSTPGWYILFTLSAGSQA